MKRKRLHPRQHRIEQGTAKQMFTALDPAISDDTIVLYRLVRDMEGKIKNAMYINPKYEK